MDTIDNIQILKNEIWIRQVTIEAEVVVIRKSQVIEKTTLLDKIKRNQTKEQEMQNKLEKDNRQPWKDNRIVYIEERIYILNNKKIQEQVLWKNYNLVNIRHLG